jgi:hypothetical protein
MFTFITGLIIFVSGCRRSTGKRFDVADGGRGCLVTHAFGFFGIAILLSAELLGLLKLTQVIVQERLGPVMWSAALCFGGYVAARLGRTTGWTNSLVVGLFAVIFLLARLLDQLIEPDWPLEKPLAYWGRLPGRLFDHLIEMLQEPLVHWVQLAALVLAIPAAVLGGFLWQWSHPTLPPKTVPHKPATLMNTILGLRFSILGLAILCLVVLAIVFRNDPAAVKAIKDRGGVVKGDPVVSVTFPSSASVKDADLKLLKELEGLRTLTLNGSKFTDAGLKELEELKGLQTVTLNGTLITDEGLNELRAALPGAKISK